ncbi:MAG: hypothetical protein KDE22_19500, partial [Rhodobacterales bacterium]|nr:hypothetical protein [Rhodobacterales bacterium]
MHLSVSLRQVNAAGEFPNLNPDSAIKIGPRELSHDGKIATHDVIFWPKAEAANIVLANSSDSWTASVVRILVERGETHESSTPGSSDTRQVGLYLDKPLLADAFNATRPVDQPTGRLFESWQTWHEAISHLGLYMSLSESNTLVLNAFTDGGAVFPSAALAPTCRFDSGTFFADGRSPEIKDAIELLLRHFDRDQRKLVLSINLNTELPRLAAWDQDPVQSESLFQRTFDGSEFRQQGSMRSIRRYNPLDSRVQAEIVAAVSELSQRYGHHPAWAGICIQLANDSQLLFAGDRWGFDPQAIHAFENFSKAKLSESMPLENLFAQAPIRQAFLDWRAREMSQLFARLALQITEVNPSAKLFLNTAQLWTHEPRTEDFFSPGNVTRNPADYLLARGISPTDVAQLPGVELVRGTFQEQLDSLSPQDWTREDSSARALQYVAPEDKPSVLIQQATVGQPLIRENPDQLEISKAWL